MPGARVVSGERLVPRTMEEEDVPFVQRESVAPEIRYPLGNAVRSRGDFEVSPEGADRFVVCLDESDATPSDPAEETVTRIAAVSVEDARYKRPGLGYWLAADSHGEGYGTAAALAVDYTFREHPTPAVGAQAFASNDASRGLLESLGFEQEGRRRQFMFVDGAYEDMVLYGLRRETWADER
ncbi:GNAT family N-acetyltransferase [Halocalculus aciditolerans]|uniref:Acetyltransferase n=1 Tax=Halocalculus aciditolerans TaxID=1383812 RepID=A0A830FHP3_9EURY|nr:GNAT family protein [Halocalculus aciditolerans]GGL48383.1 acetyltransferase [Halocalculus aciditolerans]